MDSWQALQNWATFVVLFGAVGGYYYYSELKKNKERRQSLAGRRRSEQDVGPVIKDKTGKSPRPRNPPGKKNTPPAPAPSVPEVVVDQAERDREEARQNEAFAKQFKVAQTGVKVGGSKGPQKNTSRTVKAGKAEEGRAVSTPSSQGGAEADDDFSPMPSPMPTDAHDVSDMLEPTPKGPSTIRLTAPTEPQKERVKRQPKEEVVESKKARQNRLKKQRGQEERQEQEAERKKLEEKQRRTARVARNEPAKNGVPAPVPVNNIWTAPKTETPAPAVNGNDTTQLLDTLNDNESTASSNGALEASTAATSTTEAEPVSRENGHMSEEEQVAKAMKESSDESGWTVAQPTKRQQKQKPAKNGSSAPAVQPATNGGTSRFGALGDNIDDWTA